MTELPANVDTAAERVRARAPRRSLSEQAADLRARYDALPRNRRWMVLGVLVLLGYLVTDELVWSYARKWASESEQIEAALDRGSRRASTVSTDLRRSVATFGPIDPPGPAATGREELARAIDDVMRKHKAGGYSYDARSGQRIKDQDSPILGSAIDRLQADLKFEIADTELPRLVADLESNPVIDGITSLRLQKNDQNRRIFVQATIEAWVLASGSKGAR